MKPYQILKLIYLNTDWIQNNEKNPDIICEHFSSEYLTD